MSDIIAAGKEHHDDALRAQKDRDLKNKRDEIGAIFEAARDDEAELDRLLLQHGKDEDWLQFWTFSATCMKRSKCDVCARRLNEKPSRRKPPQISRQLPLTRATAGIACQLESDADLAAIVKKYQGVLEVRRRVLRSLPGDKYCCNFLLNRLLLFRNSQLTTWPRSLMPSLRWMLLLA